MKTIKVKSSEDIVASDYIIDVQGIDFEVTDEMLQCFPKFVSGKIDEEEVETLLHDGFWDMHENKNYKLTPFYNQTVKKQDVRVEFEVEAIVELEEAPDTKFIFEFSVDRVCEGGYGNDREHILEILGEAQENFINGELVSETKSALDELVKRIKDVLVRSESKIDFSELNEFKKTIYEKLRSWEYNMTSDELDGLFADLKMHNKIDPRTMRKIENIFIDFEVDVIEKWSEEISSYTKIY